MAVVHWLDDPNRQRKPGHEHVNKIRISADAMLKLVRLKNKLLGTNRSVYEESLAQESDI